MTTHILMVCLGNICRSPAAEAAVREAAERLGVDVVVDSAGTADYHIGKPPDPRMRDAALAAGLALDSVGRQVELADFDRFDVIVAMDRTNQADLLALAPTPEAAAKVVLLSDHTDRPGTDVPDPYYGGPEGFAEVITIVREGVEALLASRDW